jgi:hypothetical protein
MDGWMDGWEHKKGVMAWKGIIENIAGATRKSSTWSMEGKAGYQQLSIQLSDGVGGILYELNGQSNEIWE